MSDRQQPVGSRDLVNRFGVRWRVDEHDLNLRRHPGHLDPFGPACAARPPALPGATTPSSPEVPGGNSARDVVNDLDPQVNDHRMGIRQASIPSALPGRLGCVGEQLGRIASNRLVRVDRRVRL